MSAIIYEDNRAQFNGNVFEDELAGLREFIQKNSDNTTIFDLSSCTDMHTAIVQLLVATKALNSCEFIHGDLTKPFAMAIDGFKVEEKV